MTFPLRSRISRPLRPSMIDPGSSMLQAMLAYMTASKMTKNAGTNTSQRLSNLLPPDPELRATGRRPAGGVPPPFALRTVAGPVGERMPLHGLLPGLFTEAGREGFAARVGR